MARNLFSRVRSLYAFARRNEPLIPLRFPSFSPPQETLEIPSFLRPRYLSSARNPRPRFISDLSSASVAEEESRDLDSGDGKIDNCDNNPKEETKPLFSDESRNSFPEKENFRPNNSGTARKKKPLHRSFSESVGLSLKSNEIDEDEVEGSKYRELREAIELMKNNLRELEEKMKRTIGKPKSLGSLFEAPHSPKTKKRKPRSVKGKALAGSARPRPGLVSTNEFSPEKKRKSRSLKGKALAGSARPCPGLVSTNEFSPELGSFVERLIEEGYMKKANFLKDGKLDLDSLCINYAKDFVKSASEQFGVDHQKVAKWISGSELKKVALVGCPQIDRKSAFSAKNIRSFFEIQENTVSTLFLLQRHNHSCSVRQCLDFVGLRSLQVEQLCSFKNKGVQTQENLSLANVLRVLTSYAVNSVHPELQVAEETKETVSKLLKEVLNLTN